MAKIHFRYEPEACRFMIGATNGVCYQEYGLQHWMSVKDVITILKAAEAEVNLH